MKILTSTLAVFLIFGVIAIQSPACAQTLEVNELILTSNVDNLTPADTLTSFSQDQKRGFAFAEIENRGSYTKVTFEWIHEGETYAEVAMTVGVSPRWRTYSSVRLQKGSWEVRVVGENNDILARRSFKVR